jgi:hypothetical protein
MQGRNAACESLEQKLHADGRYNSHTLSCCLISSARSSSAALRAYSAKRSLSRSAWNTVIRKRHRASRQDSVVKDCS